MAAAAGGRVSVLEENARLSHSIIWSWQHAFYEQRGVSAWASNLVPNFVTSNSFIAKRYAQLIAAFMRDCCAAQPPHFDPSQPFYIVELGAGHGRLSFLLLRKLSAMLELLPSRPSDAAPFKVIVTDVAESNVAFCRQHRCFAEFVRKGLVDFAVFDAEGDSELRLLEARTTLTPRSLRNPIIAVANYVFDTLRHDVFRVQEGRLHEGLINVWSERAAEPDINDPDLIDRFRHKWVFRAVPAADEYFTGRQADLNPVLARLAQLPSLRDATFLLPVGGLACLRGLLELGHGRALVVSGDKAHNSEEELRGSGEPHIARHGSFSLMVNFAAMRLYAEQRGGFALHTPHLEGFKVSVFACGLPPAGAQLLRQSFRDNVATFSPETFATLQRLVREEVAAPSQKLALAVLRLSEFDADVFLKFKACFLERVEQLGEKPLRDMLADLEAVADHYYPLVPAKDVAFELGRVFMAAHRYSRAAALFCQSLADCGPHHATHYNLALCMLYSGDTAEARRLFELAARASPQYLDVQDRLASLGGGAQLLQPPQPQPQPQQPPQPQLAAQPLRMLLSPSHLATDSHDAVAAGPDADAAAAARAARRELELAASEATEPQQPPPQPQQQQQAEEQPQQQGEALRAEEIPQSGVIGWLFGL